MVTNTEGRELERGTWVWLPDVGTSASLIPELARDLRWAWRHILVAAAAASVVMLLVSFFLPVRYDSTAVVSVVEEQPSPTLPGVAGQFSGLAGLAGIALPLDTGDRSVVVLATIKSRAFLIDFARRQALVAVLFADRYDAASGQWAPRLFGEDGPPTEEEIAEAMFERFRASKDPETGLVMLVVKGDSPETAREWNRRLIHDLNEKLRQHDIQTSERAIEYLTKQVGLTTVTELRDVYYRLIEERMKSSVLAHVSAEYAVRIVDPPSLADRPSQPRRLLMTALAGVAGALAVILIVLFRFALCPRAILQSPAV